LLRIETYSNVKIHKSLTDFEFESILSTMDAIVSYRPTYNGETSLTVIEALRHGVIPIVRRVGWFDELPDDIVCKVDNEAQVIDAVKKLDSDRVFLDKMKKKAKEYAENELSYTRYSQTILENIDSSHNTNINTNIVEAIKSHKNKEHLLSLINNINIKQ
jgi:glycosyltransferase involved in cell wall biosynthesis